MPSDAESTFASPTEQTKDSEINTEETNMTEPDTKQKRYYLCMTCGRLRAEELFPNGDCTCKICYDAGQSRVNYHEADDGGFVANNRNR